MLINILFLLCLTNIDRIGIYFNNVKNALIYNGKKYPIICKQGYLWFLLDNNEVAIYYLTETELRQIYRRFKYPAADYIYKMLTKADYNNVNYNIIKKINKYCYQCQIYKKAPGRFRFTIYNNIDFNFRIIVNIIYINQRAVLYAVNKAIIFQAVRFLPNITAAIIWDILRAIQIDIYIGPPDIIITDAGTNFINKEFISNTNIIVINVTEVPVEAYYLIRKIERYYIMVRRVYDIILAEAKINPENTL